MRKKFFFESVPLIKLFPFRYRRREWKLHFVIYYFKHERVFAANARRQTKPQPIFPEQKFNREIYEWSLRFSDSVSKGKNYNIFSCSKLYLCHFVSEEFYDRNIFFKHSRHKNMSRTCEMLKVSSLLSVATIFPTRFYKFSLEELGDVSVEWVAVQQISINSRQIMLRKVPASSRSVRNNTQRVVNKILPLPFYDAEHKNYYYFYYYCSETPLRKLFPESFLLIESNWTLFMTDAMPLPSPVT